MQQMMNILMVDDRPEDLMALKAVLESSQYNLISITSSEEALQCLLDYDVGMILLAVNMSEVNGFELAKIIRTRQECQNIPIIFMAAACQNEENLIEGYASGAVDYIFKPISPQMLKAKVDDCFRMHDCQQRINRQSEVLKRQVWELGRRNEQLTATMIELSQNKALLESVLAEKTEQISTILESIKDGFFAVDADSRFTYVNEPAAVLFGMPRQEILGKTLQQAGECSPALVEQLTNILLLQQPACFEIKCSSSEYSFEVRAYPTAKGLSVYLTDITERRLMEKEMARLDRLNLIGEMAAGIAHEIRNPMTTVCGFLQYAKNGGSELSPKNLDLMLQELDRANTIITEFLSLAKNKNNDKKLQSLASVVESLLPLIKAEALLEGKAVAAVISSYSELYIDAKEIRQLILNLTMNGLEAMGPGGILKISVYERGSEIVLSVEDRGSGIKPDIIDKIRIPFFTTKDSGTGLGLPVCYSIAARHQAVIEIKSGDWGTAISVKFKKDDASKH